MAAAVSTVGVGVAGVVVVVASTNSSFAFDQTIELSVNDLVVASSNSYRMAPRTGSQAKEGVRLNSCFTASSLRSRNAFRPCGVTAGRSIRASATPLSASPSTPKAASTRRRRTAIIPAFIGRCSVKL